MTTLQQVLQRIAGTIQQQNGTAVAQLLLQCDHESFLPQLQDQTRLTQLSTQTITIRPFDQIVALQLKSISSTRVGQHAQAVTQATQAAELLYTALDADKESNWLLPLINVLCRQLRFSSYAADAVLAQQGEKQRHMIDTQDILKRYLQKMVIDRAPLQQSKKLGCLFVIVHLFKLYFRLNNLKLCTFLTRMVKNLPDLKTYPKAQVIAYKYYLGRLNIFEEKYDDAEAELEYAFRYCTKSSKENKKRILQYLIPVKLLKCKFPLDKLLKKYELHQFSSLIQSIRAGDLESFNSNLQENQRYFIQKGIYLILEKLKIYVYRNLFRKVWKFHTSNPTLHPEFQSHQVPLELLLAALRINGTHMTNDELECILANLIFQQNMKGYIAHNRCVVLSKADPFPKVG